jgi:hypothetical protein
MTGASLGWNRFHRPTHGADPHAATSENGRGGNFRGTFAFHSAVRSRWLPIVLLAVLAAAPAHARPRCFGAAARDPLHPCANPALRLSVLPSPALAPLQPGSPCTPVRAVDLVEPCAFGAPAGTERGAVALIGDSHAAHWRSALAVVARARGLRAYAITRDSCPFSTAGRELAEPYRSQCERWKRELPAWLADHPWIHTVFLAQLTRDVADQPFAAAMASYEDARQTLPPSVERIVVIRDSPEARYDTLTCVGRALARRVPAGPACAVPRRAALLADPAAAAAEQLGSGRVRSVDLTSFFCGPSRCFPVVGGVLVYKDENHLTPLFAQTLGPYLLRAVRGMVQ